MPERATVTRRVRGGASRAQGAGQAAMDRLTQSVEAAQEALKDLSKELTRGRAMSSRTSTPRLGMRVRTCAA